VLDTDTVDTLDSAPLGSHRDRCSFQHIPFRIFRVGLPVEGTHPRCDREQSRGGESSMSEEREEWRAVPGCTGYEASTLGRVRSIPRHIRCSNGVVKYRKRTTVLVGSLRRNGYLYISPCRDGERHKCEGIHVVIAATFLGPRPAGYDVRHLDGNRLNNRPSNIAYGTRSQNMADAKRHGYTTAGASNPMATFSEELVLEIRRLHRDEGWGFTRIARHFGLASISHTRQLALGLKWKHL